MEPVQLSAAFVGTLPNAGGTSPQPNRGPQVDADFEQNRTPRHYSELLESLLKDNGLLTNEEAAAYLGVTPRTLEVWRCTKRHNIAYIKVGRLVKYTQKALDNFLASRTVDA
jgi:excisionase family DNA binding protein